MCNKQQGYYRGQNMNINELAKNIYLQNKAVGWWDNPDRCIYETLQLVSTELAEATEGERKDLMDDHLPNRKMGEVELADALVRVLDLGGRYGWKYNEHVPHHPMIDKIKSIGGQHLVCNMALADLTGCIFIDVEHREISAYYSILISSILYVGHISGYDIEGAMYEKLEYNKHRADHKRENREKANGKKF